MVPLVEVKRLAAYHREDRNDPPFQHHRQPVVLIQPLIGPGVRQVEARIEDEPVVVVEVTTPGVAELSLAPAAMTVVEVESAQQAGLLDISVMLMLLGAASDATR